MEKKKSPKEHDLRVCLFVVHVVCVSVSPCAHVRA